MSTTTELKKFDAWLTYEEPQYANFSVMARDRDHAFRIIQAIQADPGMCELLEQAADSYDGGESRIELQGPNIPESDYDLLSEQFPELEEELAEITKQTLSESEQEPDLYKKHLLEAAAPKLAEALLELLHASNFDPEKPLSDNAAALSRIAMAQAKAKTAYENATGDIVYFEE